MSNQEKTNITGILLFLLIFLLTTVSVVTAHQPRLDTGATLSIENPIIITDPEVSQAFYGELNGQPDYYKITSDKAFKFYLNLLVPASPGIPPDYISAEVIDSSGNTIITIKGTNSTWETYFEEFGGDYYLKGPEVRADLNPGTYYIKVFNSKNQGKYSIAVGEIESFPLDESLAAVVTIPLLKEQIFGKPVTILFFQFLGIILALGTIMVQFFMIIKSRKSEEITELTRKVSGHLRPLMWAGLILTTIVWFYVMYKDPLNIVGIINTILLIILLILSWNIGNKLKKLEYGKTPLIRSVIWIVLWWVFVYWAIAVI
jgi:hypothetical protein